MDYITAKEAADKWGISRRAVSYHIAAGRIPGAVRKGSMWLIPSFAARPEDLRKNNHRCPKKEDGK